MSKREFLQQYVVNASIGAGNKKLNVKAAVEEANDAWRFIEESAPARRAAFKPGR